MSCPYCNSAKSLLLGNIYCSHQGKSMAALENGAFYLKSKRLEETNDHVSRLSIRCTLNGEQHYKVGSHEHLIDSQKYLVINQGQHYKTSFENSEEQSMLLVAFKPGFAEGLLRTMNSSEENLLDDPFKENEPVHFFEKTYDADPVLMDSFNLLSKLINESMEWRKTVDLDSLYTTMLERFLCIHRKLNSQIEKLKCVKRSTRVELFNRLCIAKDLMDANLDRRLSVEEIANAACLSPHHFKRTFKQLFNISPHAYHVKKRLAVSRILLSKKELKVNEICRRVGFEDVSSFIRLFRREFGITPGFCQLKT